MKIYYDPRRCGAGKTYSRLQQMVSAPSKTVYVMDRTKVIPERYLMIEELAQKSGTSPRIEVIAAIHKTNHISVGEKIEAIPRTYTDEHIIVIVMSEGMKSACFDKSFRDWDIVIDEDVNIFRTERWNLSASREHFEDNYRLDPIGEDVFKIERKPCCPTVADYRGDQTFSEAMVDFRKILDSQSVFTKDPKFASSCTWWTIWSFENLSAFKSVTMLANAFTSKLSYKLASLTTSIEFVPLVSTDDRVWARRKITLRHFAANHPAKTSTFETEMGHSNLRKIAIWTRARLTKAPREHYWCTNLHSPISFPGYNVGPKTSGRNDLQSVGYCTAIYSAKARPADKNSLRAITGGVLGYADVHRDRELEDLAQFMLRGALWDPNDSQPFEMAVYDVDQAEFLKTFLIENRYAVEDDIEIVHENIGLDDPIEETREDTPKLTPLERKRLQRARDKEAGVKRTHR